MKAVNKKQRNLFLSIVILILLIALICFLFTKVSAKKQAEKLLDDKQEEIVKKQNNELSKQLEIAKEQNNELLEQVQDKNLQKQREELLQNFRTQFEKINQDDNDTTTVEATSRAGLKWETAEIYLPIATAMRLRISPEDTIKTLQDIYELAQTTDRIFYDPSNEFLGTAESWRRYSWIAYLIKRQIEIFLAAPETYALWQRVRSANGNIQNESFTLKNGRSFYHPNIMATFENDEILLNPDLCFVYKGSDYAILIVDQPKSMSLETYTSYFVNIKEQKIKIIEELGEFPVRNFEVKNDYLLIFRYPSFFNKDANKPKIINLKEL